MKYKNKYCIIVKFTKNDNIPLSDSDTGWVDYFTEILKTALNYQVKSEIEIIYKSETDLISPEDFNLSDLIIYILSPAFIVSSNINQDATALETAFNFDIPFINHKVKKVFKAPVKIEELPLSLSTPTYYRFYNVTAADEIEYQTFEGWNEYQDNHQFWTIMADILNDTFRIFLQNQEEFELKIFISNKSEEYFNDRNSIKRELKSYKTQIYPDEDFSIEANYMDDAELFFMKKCDLSLHFPDEFLDLDIIERDKAFNKLTEQKRFIWFNPQQALKPEKTARYNELKVQLKPYKNIEAVEAPIEELKTILKEQLFSKDTEPKQEDADSVKELIYIVSDTSLEESLKNAINKEAFLKEKFRISILNNVDNVTNFRLLHYELLRTADYFVILNFKNNQEWLKSMISEIRKAPGFKRKKQIKGKYILGQTLSLPNKYVEENFSLIPIKRVEEIVDYLKEIN
ncbi:hypothetical protein JKA74_14420 [Marivirga sp. S37H4]|uniref:TIR domain-containing protein n=1 Tax=Marivirga aurantiaca TaxID=2802615 RepID=A0A934X0H8_9BACT|nr:hypothetical protein [Marivirga aurantiaca]MBK6266237.1 hypothetical protein [Marivirga aurantiaca]